MALKVIYYYFLKGVRAGLQITRAKLFHTVHHREKQDTCSMTPSRVTLVRGGKLEAKNLFQTDEPRRPESAKVDTKSVLPFGNIP